MPLYLTKEKPTGDQLLVDAPSENAALKHVSLGRFDVAIIRKPGEVARLMASGVKLETAGETEPKPTEPSSKSPPPVTGDAEG